MMRMRAGRTIADLFAINCDDIRPASVIKRGSDHLARDADLFASRCEDPVRDFRGLVSGATLILRGKYSGSGSGWQLQPSPAAMPPCNPGRDCNGWGAGVVVVWA
jgi:hypothetical protein